MTEEPGGYNPDEGESPPAGATVTVRGYLPVDSTTRSRRAMIDVGLRLISQIEPLPPLRERILDPQEWEHQEFEPVRVGQRLVIVRPGVGRGDDETTVAVPVEPGLAFGTGHHPTTRMCLVLLERLMPAGARVLDVGCGSGILAIAALKLGAESAVCLDVDADAVESARRNARAAGVENAAVIERGSLPHPLAPERAFDVVLANISAKVLIDLADALLECTAPGGVVIGSGAMTDRQGEVARAFAAAGGDVEETVQAGDWAAFLVRRRGAPPARGTES